MSLPLSQFSFSGNIQYRKLVKAYRGMYVQSSRRIKPKVAQCIVYSVRQMGGRFLKRVESGSGGKDSDETISTTSSNNNSSSGGAWWVDVGNVKAREKTSQALREGAPDLRSVTATGTTIQMELPSSPSAVSFDAISASGGIESTNPSFAIGESPSALERHSSAIPSHSAASSGNRYPATPVGHDYKLPISGSHSLTNHPLFHTLSPYQKHQILMEEVHAAREAAELAALRSFRFQQGLHDPFGQSLHNNLLPGECHAPVASYDHLGSMAAGNGVSPSLQERTQSRMNPNQQHLSWNGSGGGLDRRHLNENQRKRSAQAASSSPSSELFVDTGMDDDKANTTCRGPRLKRLKQRRQLEA
jgi:hypothetical protein